MSHQVATIIGIGGMGEAIARRQGLGKTLVLADFNGRALEETAERLRADGYTVKTRSADVSDRDSVAALAAYASEIGAVTEIVHTAGVSPAMADIAAILRVDLVGVAIVLDEFAKVVAPGGAGVVISSMAGYSYPALPEALERALENTPAEDLPEIDLIRQQAVNPAAAYGLAKKANHSQVRFASLAWGARGARINSVSPGIISTPMGLAELAGAHGRFMRQMIQSSGTGRIGTPGDIAALTAFLLSSDASFITGTDILIDGGVIASSSRKIE